MHRADAYTETNTTLVLAAEKEKCEAQVTQQQWDQAAVDSAYKETLRKWIQQCTAPKNGVWNTGL